MMQSYIFSVNYLLFSYKMTNIASSKNHILFLSNIKMKIIRLSSVILALLISAILEAKDVKTMFLSTPDSIMTMVDKSGRERFLMPADSADVVRNALGGEVRISVLEDNLIVFHSSEARVLEYRMLPTEKGDSLLCLIDTYFGPVGESTVTFYDCDWNVTGRFDLREFCDKSAILDSAENLSNGTLFPELENPLVSASFDKKREKVLVMTSCLPVLNDEEKNKQKTIKVQTNLKWDGGMFKRCE